MKTSASTLEQKCFSPESSHSSPSWTASVVLAHYGSLNEVPDALSAWDPAVRQELRGAAKLAERLATERELALLFATLRTKPPVLRNVGSLRWRGPKSDFEDVCRHFRDPGLADRAAALAKKG